MKLINYDRLLQLKTLIDNGIASTEEKKEYMLLLRTNGNITIEQYDSYLSNKNRKEIIDAALVIGGFIVAAWLISKLLRD